MHQAPPPVPPAPPISPWPTVGLTAAAVFLVSLDATVVVAAFPAFRTDFASASPALLSWTLNAYTIVCAALLVPAGRVADLWSRKRLFVVGAALFTLASALCATAPGPTALVAARVLQGVGAALLTPSSLALVLRAFPAERRAAAVGLWSAVGALAAAVGPAQGSCLIDHASWRWAFLITLPVGVVAAWRAHRRLAEFTAADGGASPDLPGPLMVIPVAVLCGRIAGRTGQRPLLVAGGLLYAAAQALLALRVDPMPDYLRVWLPSQVLTGIAIGLVLPSLSAAAVAGLPPARFGVGSGVSNALRQIGGALGAAIAVALIGRSAVPLEAFRTLFWLLAASGLAVASVALPLGVRGRAAPIAPARAGR